MPLFILNNVISIFKNKNSLYFSKSNKCFFYFHAWKCVESSLIIPKLIKKPFKTNDQ